MAVLDLGDVRDNNGKCFLAIENNKAVGLIMGRVANYEENDYLDYKCPKKGEITELIISKKVRSNRIGQKLMKKMEAYFKSIDCEHVIVDVFAYNELALNFYRKQGYHTRMLVDIKNL